VGPIARALAVAAMVTIAVAGCGSAVGSPAAPSGAQSAAPAAAPSGAESAAPALPCPSGERYVVGRVYPMGACLPATSEQASCAPGEHAVVGRVNPLGECYPDARPTPIRSCPPGERLVVGRVNSMETAPGLLSVAATRAGASGRRVGRTYPATPQVCPCRWGDA
jgi:hypothetical protein